jgi:hypothetical protein
VPRSGIRHARLDEGSGEVRYAEAAGATVDTDPLQGQAAGDLIGRCPGFDVLSREDSRSGALFPGAVSTTVSAD